MFIVCSFSREAKDQISFLIEVPSCVWRWPSQKKKKSKKIAISCEDKVNRGLQNYQAICLFSANKITSVHELANLIVFPLIQFASLSFTFPGNCKTFAKGNTNPGGEI